MKEKLIKLLESVEHQRRLYPDLYVDMLISKGVTIQKQGKWEQIQQWGTKAKYRCSVCGREIMSTPNKVNMEKYPYCHCGAKMSD